MKSKRLFWILIALNVLMVVGIIGTFSFASKIAKTKSAAIAVKKAQISNNEKSLDNFQTLEHALNQNKEVEDIAAKVLPQDKEQSVVIKEINKFATAADINLDDLTFVAGSGPTTTKTSTPTLTTPSGLKGVYVLKVQITGKNTSINNMLDFMKLIEDNRRRMQVTSISIKPNLVPAKDSQGKIIDVQNYVLGIDIYLKP